MTTPQATPTKTPLPSATIPDPDKTQYLTLGALNEELHETDAAIRAYEVALQSTSVQVQRSSLEALQRLRRKKHDDLVRHFVEEEAKRFGKIIGQLAVYLVLALVTFALLKALLGLLVRIRRRLPCTPRLAILPFSSGPAGEVSSTSFENAVEVMMHAFHRQAQLTKASMRGVSAAPEMRSKSLLESASELAVTVAPGARPLVDWLVRRVTMPDYVVVGSSMPTDSWHHVILILKYRGKVLKTWSASFEPKDLIEKYKDLAYEVLVRIRSAR